MSSGAEAFSVVSPATQGDLAEACAVRLSPVQWLTLKAQIDEGLSWALRDVDGSALVVAGLWPSADGSAFAWFMASPAARGRGQVMREVVRRTRLTLSASAYRRITVKVETRAGARLARLAGFVPIDGDGGLHEFRRGRRRPEAHR